MGPENAWVRTIPRLALFLLSLVLTGACKPSGSSPQIRSDAAAQSSRTEPEWRWVRLRAAEDAEGAQLSRALTGLEQRIAAALPEAAASLHGDLILLKLPESLPRALTDALWQRTFFSAVEVDPAPWFESSPQLLALPDVDYAPVSNANGETAYRTMAPQMVASPRLLEALPRNVALQRVLVDDQPRTVPVLSQTRLTGRCLSAKAVYENEAWLLRCELKEPDALALEHLSDGLRSGYVAVGIEPNFVHVARVPGSVRLHALSLSVPDQRHAMLLAASLNHPLPFELRELGP